MAFRLFGIIWTNIGPLGTNVSEILIKLQNFSFTKMHMKISSAKWRTFCSGGDELITNNCSAICVPRDMVVMWMPMLQTSQHGQYGGCWWPGAYLPPGHLHPLWWRSAICVPRDMVVIVRRAGLLWSQQDFEWRWSVPLFKCLTVLEFSLILFDLCLLITFFNFIMNDVPIVTFWIFTYHKIWILSIMLCFIWSYWIIYFLACLEVSWRVVS